MRSIALVPGLLAATAAFVGVVLGVGFPTASPRAAGAVEVESDVSVRVGDLQRLKVGSVQITPNVLKIEGEGAIFLVNTSEGSVLIDIGYDSPQALEQKKLIEKLATGPQDAPRWTKRALNLWVSQAAPAFDASFIWAINNEDKK